MKFVATFVLAACLAVGAVSQVKIGGTNVTGGTMKTGVAGGGGGCTGTLCTGLVASWKLDDLTDATGRGNTLTNNNSATFVAGEIGNAVNLVAASSQSLSIAHNADVNPGDTDFTIGFRFKPTSDTGTYQALFSKKDGATADTMRLTWNGTMDGLIFSIYNSGGGTAGSIAVAPGFSPGTSYCIIAWVNAAADTIHIRVNDTAFIGDDTTNSAMNSGGSVPFRIGMTDETGFTFPTDGVIDNFNIWHKALSAGERTAFCGALVEYPYTTP